MQKYLLLLLMCLVGTMGVQAKITVVPPEESATGAYELTFSNGEVGEGEYANIAALPDFVKNAKSLLMKTNTGYSLSDYEISQIMGGNNNSTVFTNLEELDMGDAVLKNNASLSSMKYAKESGKGLNKLKYFVFPQTTTSIPSDMFSGNTTIEEVILLENASLKTITGGAFQGCTSLAKVRIPDGVENIGVNAFENCAFEAIHLPNSLKNIGSNAFDACRNLKTITIPASVTFIGASAFQRNTSLTDVYIIGNDVEIGDQAFDHNLTQNGFVYGANKDGNPNEVTIRDWQKDDGTLPLRLHVPNNDEALARYMNPNLRFLNALASPSMVRQAMIDKNINSNPTEQEVALMITNISKFINERWFDNMNAHPEAQDCKNVIDQLKETCNAWHIYNYSDLLNTWEEMEGWRYYHEASGKFNFGPGTSTSPYAGWWNFMFLAGDIENKTWPDGRMIDSRWYSAVFPFNMSYNQLISAYGNGTDVREFSYVNEYEVDGQLMRTVTFNKVISGPRLGRGNRIDRDAPNYIEKGRPYMIHPGVRSVPVEVNGETVYRTIAGVDVSEATATVQSNTDLIVVEGDLIRNGDTSDVIASKAYNFKGTYQQGTIPANTFYLGYEPPTYPLAFYITRKDLPNKWTAFTSIVRKTNETGASTAKVMGIDFSVIFANEENFGITTKIESPKNDRVESQKVYNLSGQVVRENNGSLQGLSKGVYVVNGKKVVVR